MSQRANQQPAGRVGAVAVVGTVLVIAYALLALVQILVLNPLAAVPGAGLGEIYDGVAAAGESMSVPGVVVCLAVGPAIAFGLLRRVWRGPEVQTRGVVAAYLALLALGAVAYFWASFGPGMSLADTYGISGGDHSPWAVPLHVTSGVGFVALIAMALGAVSGVGRRGGISRDRDAGPGLGRIVGS